MIKKYHVSKNLFDKTTITTGGYVDKNGYHANQAYYHSDYIPVSQGTYYLTNIVGSSYQYCGATYDSSKNPLRNLEINSSSTTASGAISINATEYYMRINMRITTDVNTVMVNVGNSAQPYEPYGNSWNTIGYKKYGTETETFSTLPKTIIGDGQNISAYTIKGNMSQSGTPTPSNPIYPTEVGDKTANLLNYNRQRSNTFTTDVKYYIYGGVGNSTNTETSATNVNISISDNSISVYSRSGHGIGYVVEVQPDTTYTLSFDKDLTLDNKSYAVLNLLTEESQFGTMETIYDKTYSFTTNNSTKYVYIVLRVVGETCVYSNIMLNLGSTAPPYEPYGYEIPILSNGTTYPIYLSEPIRKIGDSVDSLISTGTVTYSIKKIVLTGDETCYPYSYQSTNGIEMINMLDVNYQRTNGICSHYPVATTGSANSLWIGVNNKTLYFVGILDNLGLSSSTAFKQWLATQYANGTPVTVWYVLATAETETFTAPTLPTSGTAQTFDVDTTLKPSEVSLTYHGWHEHSDEKYVGGVVNKFNYLTMADGVIGSYLNSNGAVIESSNWSITDYIPCDGTTFTLYPIGGNAPAMCLYNSNKQLLVAKSYNSGGSETTIPVTITSSSTASYARFSYYSGGGGADLTQIMFVEGSTVPSEYHPYYEWVEE